MKKNIFSLLLLLGAFQLSACAVQPPATPAATPTSETQALRDKILPEDGDIGAHDPTIIKEGSVYYRFITGPNIPMACSPDLRQWTSCGHVFLAKPGWTIKAVPGVAELWAPDIAFFNGKFHLYYSASTFGSNLSAIGLVTSPTLDPKNPSSVWTDEGVVVQSTFKDTFNAIDPNIVLDNAGQPWLAYGSYWSGIKLRKLDPQTGKPPAGDTQVTDIAQRQIAPYAIEGAFILPRNGEYFLFVSFDACCKGIDSDYKIMVGRSKTITGPYLDHSGKSMMSGGGSLVLDSEARWRGPGHNSILVDGAKTYLVYHAYDASAAGTPRLRVEELVWDADGWPISPTMQLKSRK
jgi:arabinan endo-1,5-alpha-L-arabinosidase